MPLPRSRPTDSVDERVPQAAPPTAAAESSKAGKPAKTAKTAKPAKLAKTVDKLAKLGLTRDIDLVLHLPMRYEDETTLTPIGGRSGGS